MLTELSNELYERQRKLSQVRSIHSYFLKEMDSMMLIESALIPIMEGCAQYKNLASVCIKIGTQAMRIAGVKFETRKALYCGWFILLSYINLKLVKYELSKSRNKRNKYQEGFRLRLVEEQTMYDMFEELTERPDEEERLLSMAPNNRPENWETSTSKTGLSIVKKSSDEEFDKSQNKILYRVLNKLNNTGWRVNREVYEIYKYYLDNDTEKSPFKHKMMNPISKKEHQAQQSHKITADMVYAMATRSIGKPFYHLYSLDFRGRIYPNSAYLNEQSNDAGRGLLLLNSGKPIGSGEKHFYLHGSNVFGSKKATTPERLEEIESMHDLIMSIADDPIGRQEWIDTEKPFMFLAWCMEYKKYKKDPNYICYLPIFIDASCSGMQHLAALSLDETIGKFTNLVPSDEPQDLYMYVADSLWNKLEDLSRHIPQEMRDQFDELWEEGQRRYAHYHKLMADEDEGASDYYKQLNEWRKETKEAREKLYPVYWLGLTDEKLKRKTLKRNVMTFPYLSSAYGKGTQIWDDTRGLSDYLNKADPVWCYKLGRLSHTTCYKILEGPGMLLKLFKFISELFNNSDRYLSWKVPLTNFHVKQQYSKRTKQQAALVVKKNRTIQVVFWENKGKLNTRGQRNGTAANIIHSLDACHMSLVIDKAPFDVVGIHDSFGCLPADMADLHKIVREEFIRLYETGPLDKILKTMNIGSSVDLVPKLGSLNLRDIANSEYCFY